MMFKVKIREIWGYYFVKYNRNFLVGLLFVYVVFDLYHLRCKTKFSNNSLYVFPSISPYDSLVGSSYFAFVFQSVAETCGGAGMGVPGYMGFNAPGVVGYIQEMLTKANTKTLDCYSILCGGLLRHMINLWCGWSKILSNGMGSSIICCCI